MNDKPILLLDLDGVIVDLATTMREAYQRIYGREVKPEDIYKYDLPSIMGLDRRAWLKLLTMPGMHLNPKPYKGAVSTVAALMRVAEVYLVSAVPQYASCLWEKHQWVNKWLPFLGSDRLIVCQHKHLCRGNALLDDYHRNLVNFRGKRLLADAPWNRDHNSFIRVGRYPASLATGYEQILKELNLW